MKEIDNTIIDSVNITQAQRLRPQDGDMNYEQTLRTVCCKYCGGSHKKVKKKNFLFVTYTIIQSITSSEMCSLHLTHPSGHTPGAVGSQTLGRPGSSWGFGALFKRLTSVEDNY